VTTQYATLDAAIFAHVAAGKLNPPKCEALHAIAREAVECIPGQEWRVIVRRLEVLRREGRIEFVIGNAPGVGTWRSLEPVEGL
jgi:hypothetical protein